ncbi:carotenoid 1,2-hydratase [Robbsia sp. Bb-Pol-6]|uniref:Carotenoid 1,2-hydratase n=1 Tax=Robbsia betulipollinis TaxID=2981849 RepID=A0ABT3ZJ41_9BURK|nr:carotenoid 1,2-hydratase [Robbsia betulipollinis]MCY0386554.1 carotenoid 1,2-hydratase [Robbsia betulipollinis]
MIAPLRASISGGLAGTCAALRALWCAACFTMLPGAIATAGAAAPVDAAPVNAAASSHVPAFATVVPGRPIVFPRDGGAHPAFRTEWWYATGWLVRPDGRPLGFQITFFRSATGTDPANPSAFAPTQLIIAHAALSDPGLGHLLHDQRIARQGFDLAYAREAGTDVKLDDWHLVRAADGHYTATVQGAGFTLNLTLTPTQAPLLQGDAGYSRKGPLASQASYYYSEPQLRVSGAIGVDVDVGGGTGGAGGANTDSATAADGKGTGALAPGQHGGAIRQTPVTGLAWLDHEWSSTVLSTDATGWDWLGANLDDGSALMAFKVRARDGHAVWAHAALRGRDGRITAFGPDAVTFTPLREWSSPRTAARYPVAQTVKTGALTWQLDPLFDDQELDSRQSTGAVYWEGAVRVRRNGQSVGRGYLEMTGYDGALKFEK